MVTIEFTNEDVGLLTMLLDKELGETRVEIHHAKNPNYKEQLKARETEVRTLLDRIAPGSRESAS